MLTALDIERKTGGFLRLFRRNRIRVEHSFCDVAAVKIITYEHYRRKIAWSAIDRFVKAQRNRLLCAPDLELPAQLGYRRFESDELSRRMCENASIFLLRSAPDARVALVDPEGIYGVLCEELADIAAQPTVITGAVEYYRELEEKLLNEKGAALNIRKSTDTLKNADIIIAPLRLEQALPCSASAVILSGERPSVAQPAPVIYRYYLDLPSKIRQLKPDFLDDMYFASALYESGVHELGSELFYRCGDGTTIHTRQSLADMLKKSLNSLDEGSKSPE